MGLGEKTTEIQARGEWQLYLDNSYNEDPSNIQLQNSTPHGSAPSPHFISSANRLGVFFLFLGWFSLKCRKCSGPTKLRSTGQGENVIWDSWEKSWSWRPEGSIICGSDAKRSFGAVKGKLVYTIAFLNPYL